MLGPTETEGLTTVSGPRPGAAETVPVLPSAGFSTIALEPGMVAEASDAGRSMSTSAPEEPTRDAVGFPLDDGPLAASPTKPAGFAAAAGIRSTLICGPSIPASAGPMA